MSSAISPMRAYLRFLADLVGELVLERAGD